MQIPFARRLLGTPARSSDGQPLGRVVAVYVPDGLSRPLLVALPSEGTDALVVPLFGAGLDDDGLVLGYPAAQVVAGPVVDAEAALSLGEVGAVLAYYVPGLAGKARRLAVTERAPEIGDVGAGAGVLHSIPPFPGIGDEDLPPIVVTSPGATG